MKLELKEVRDIARTNGFIPATVEKVLRLAAILSELMEHPFLKDRLALKGGTAIQLFHLNGQRLSVDLDLNYIGNLSREDML